MKDLSVALLSSHLIHCSVFKVQSLTSIEIRYQYPNLWVLISKLIKVSLAYLSFQRKVSGGDSRDRTGDLLLARQALSQLSYIPNYLVFRQDLPKAFFAYFLSRKKVGGGPEWARTTDLTIISRTL